MENKNSTYNKVGTSYQGIPSSSDGKNKPSPRRRLALAKAARKGMSATPPPPPLKKVTEADLPAPGQLTRQGRMYVGVPDGTGIILREFT